MAVGEKLDLGGDVVDRINDPVGAGDEVVALLAIAPEANFGFNAGREELRVSSSSTLGWGK